MVYRNIKVNPWNIRLAILESFETSIDKAGPEIAINLTDLKSIMDSLFFSLEDGKVLSGFSTSLINKYVAVRESAARTLKKLIEKTRSHLLLVDKQEIALKLETSAQKETSSMIAQSLHDLKLNLQK